MFTRKAAMAFAIALSAGAAAAGDGPGLGMPLEPEDVEAIDFTVLPDGSGLPAGGGDAVAGREVYRAHCAACHGEEGDAGINDKLVGGHGSIGGPVPDKTVGSYWPYATTVFDYVRRAMPYQAPGSLSDDEIYAVTAYLLFLNGVIGERDEMNGDTLPAVRMPNRDNFVWSWKPD